MAHRIDNGDALLMESWDADLREESQEQDIYTGLTGTFSENEKGEGKIPDGIMQRVTLKPGMNTHTIGMLLDLDGAGRQGAGKVLRGYLESPTTRFMTVRANDIRHGVENELFGLYHHREVPYHIAERMMNKNNGLLARWRKARRGKHIRQAGLQGFSDNLVEAPTSQTLRWNRRILVKNVANASQPAYDSTLATYEGNLVTALTAAGTSSAASIDPGMFSYLNYWVTNVCKMQPMDSGRYIVTVPGAQAPLLTDLDNSSSLKRIQASTFSEKIAGMTFQQTLGDIGKFSLVVDDRAPIVVWNTATGSLTSYYRDVGSNDDRLSYSNDGTNRVYDVMFIHGRGGITETQAMAPRYDTQLEDIGRIEEIGMSMTEGYQVTEFDDDTATDSTRIGQNIAVVLLYRGTLTP